MSNENGIRAGFVGLGRRGRVVLKNFLECGNRFDLVALCDPNVDNAEGAIQFIENCEKQSFMNNPSYQEARKASNIGSLPRYTSWQKMLEDSNIEALIVATSTHHHYEVVMQALAKKLHVYSEKPLAPTLKMVEEICDAAKNSGTVFQVGLQMRYSPVFQKVRGLLDAGEIGLPQMIYLHEFRKPFSFDWQFSNEQSGGALCEKCIHHFDLFNWYAGAEAVRVYASGGQNVIKKGNIIDNSWVVVDYANGIRASLGLSLYSPRQTRSFGIAGSLGTLQDRVGYENIGGANTYELHVTKDTAPGQHCPKVFSSQTFTFSMQDYLAHTQNALTDFANCITGGGRPLTGSNEAIAATRICFAAEKSIKERRPVELREL